MNVMMYSNGFEVFNFEPFPFSLFCRIDKGESEEYYPTVFYLSLEDMYDETNPITNSEVFVNITNPQNYLL